MLDLPRQIELELLQMSNPFLRYGAIDLLISLTGFSLYHNICLLVLIILHKIWRFVSYTWYLDSSSNKRLNNLPEAVSTRVKGRQSFLPPCVLVVLYGF